MQIGEELTLADGPYTVRIAPAAGARLTRLQWRRGSRLHDLVVPWPDVAAFDPHDWPKAGAFPLAPFNNKLGGARFRWQGREVQLEPAPGQRHALHGFGHRAAWTVERATGREALLRLRHPAGAHRWPWPFTLSMAVAVGEGGVGVQLALRNDAAEAMPAALGWHPFHPLPCAAARGRGLRLKAGAREDLGRDGLRRLLPAAAPPRAHRCRLTRPGTHVFTDWDGSMALALDEAFDLHVRSTGAPHLLCHVPAHARHACLEPVSAVPGALAHDGAQWRDALALPPGGVRRLSWHCSAQAIA